MTLVLMEAGGSIRLFVYPHVLHVFASGHGGQRGSAHFVAVASVGFRPLFVRMGGCYHRLATCWIFVLHFRQILTGTGLDRERIRSIRMESVQQFPPR